MRAAAVVIAASLAGCSGSFSIPPQPLTQPQPLAAREEGPQAPMIIDRDTGETPAVCYVRARNFKGLVPLSCTEAQMIRP